MAGHIINLIGRTFGRLIVIERAENSRFRKARWRCKCSCGNIVIVCSDNLRRGLTKSCGCFRKDVCTKNNTTHGMYGTSEYKSWFHIITRCQNPNDKYFKDYGGRGISICQEWRDSFLAFYNHVGKRPSLKHSIDRINNDGNYKPGNVRWSLLVEQANNKRSNVLITINNTTMNVTQWAHEIGINCHTIFSRLQRNWDPQKAVLRPIRKRKIHSKSFDINRSLEY